MFGHVVRKFILTWLSWYSRVKHLWLKTYEFPSKWRKLRHNPYVCICVRLWLSLKQSGSLRRDSSFQQNINAPLCSNPTSKVIIHLDKWWFLDSPLQWQLCRFLEHPNFRSGSVIYSLNLYCELGGGGVSQTGGEWQRQGYTVRNGESEEGNVWNGVCRLSCRQISLVELQIHFLFACPCMPHFLIALQCHLWLTTFLFFPVWSHCFTRLMSFLL